MSARAQLASSLGRLAKSTARPFQSKSPPSCRWLTGWFHSCLQHEIDTSKTDFILHLIECLHQLKEPCRSSLWVRMCMLFWDPYRSLSSKNTITSSSIEVLLLLLCYTWLTCLTWNFFWCDSDLQGPKRLAALVHDVAETRGITSQQAQTFINEDPKYFPAPFLAANTTPAFSCNSCQLACNSQATYYSTAVFCQRGLCTSWMTTYAQPLSAIHWRNPVCIAATALQ